MKVAPRKISRSEHHRKIRTWVKQKKLLILPEAVKARYAYDLTALDKEHRAMRAEMIHQWKPWLKSTGAKTEEGKRKSAMNAYKGGHRKRQRLINKSLNDCFEALSHVTCSEGLL